MIALLEFRQEAAGALWNLSFDDRNREAIAAAGGVEALVGYQFVLLIVSIINFLKNYTKNLMGVLQVALAQSCSTGSHGLQERAAGALWGLSVSEANR